MITINANGFENEYLKYFFSIVLKCSFVVLLESYPGSYAAVAILSQTDQGSYTKSAMLLELY